MTHSASSGQADLVERLRTWSAMRIAQSGSNTLKEAADEIEKLRAEVKTQRNRIASLKGLIEDEEEAERL